MPAGREVQEQIYIDMVKDSREKIMKGNRQVRIFNLSEALSY